LRNGRVVFDRPVIELDPMMESALYRADAAECAL
jgi:hypothetical protein